MERRMKKFKSSTVDSFHTFLIHRRNNKTSPFYKTRQLYTIFTSIINIVESYTVKHGETLLLTMDIEKSGIKVFEHEFVKVPLLQEYFNRLNEKYPYETHQIQDVNDYTQEFISDMKRIVEHFRNYHSKWNISVEPNPSPITTYPPTLYICDNYLSWEFIY